MAKAILEDDRALFLDWAIARSKEIASGKCRPPSPTACPCGESPEFKPQLVEEIALAMMEAYDLLTTGSVELLRD